MITVDSGKDPVLLATHSLERFLTRARAAVGLTGSISVLLTSDAELQRLNRQFRRKDKPTDVLSFPAEPVPGLPAAHRHAGDLAISLDTAARQAAEHGHPLASELRILLLHGLLHLSGLDHETDSGEMAAREAQLRARFRLPDTLIARTLAASPPRASSPSRRSPAALASAARTRKAAPRTPQPATVNKQRSTL